VTACGERDRLEQEGCGSVEDSSPGAGRAWDNKAVTAIGKGSPGIGKRELQARWISFYIRAEALHLKLLLTRNPFRELKEKKSRM
jgi:hypothetical protein